jgi:hypothetical protein
MLGAAESQDWETLARLEADRRALSDSLPDAASAELPRPQSSTRARRLIEACLRCDTLHSSRWSRGA